MIRGNAVARPLLPDCRAGIAIIFAIMLIPLSLVTGLAIDYSLYVEAQSQLNLAADAAALHAVRVASNAYQNGYVTTATELQAAQTAGQQWFTAQLGPLADVANANATITVTYRSTTGSFTSSVVYTASLPTNFGSLLPSTWPISGSAASTVSAGYVEVVMLIDNSSSMLIGATDADIAALEAATPCSTQSASAGQPMMGTYAWNYSNSAYRTYGYGSGYTPPPTTPTNGACDSGYTGSASACFYVPTSIGTIKSSTGLCTNGGGVGSVPQAPCAFACHSDAGGNDYYGLALSLSPPVTLRLNVVHNAAASVISSLQSNQQMVNQFSVGVYEFNTALQPVYPGSGRGEAGPNLAAALADVQALAPVVTANSPDTDFPEIMQTLAGQMSPAGNGATPATPMKNLFIVTDGMLDDQSSGSRVMGPFTSTSDERTCAMFKNMGFVVYVLYTPFLPLPNAFYIQQNAQYAEPTNTSPIVAALQACASAPGTFFQASSPTDIQAAMQSMLKSALATAGRISS